MKHLLLAFLPLLSSWCQQLKAQNNLIPNPGFEQLNQTAINWYHNGKIFTQVSKYWESGIYTSPDLYYPRVRVPKYWKERGFGATKAHKGACFAGITCYGCGKQSLLTENPNERKPHCREYIMALLAEPLVPGQHYYFEMWVKPLLRGMRINHLGMALSMEKPDYFSEPNSIGLSPTVNATEVLKSTHWQKVFGTFVADNAYEYLLIGNFLSDDSTSTLAPDKVAEPLGYAYYYIDDVLLKKVPPILPIPIPEDDITRIPLAVGKTIELKHLYFEFDKWDLHPRSYVELKKLAKIMKKHPRMKIQINGHTDNQGTEEYNVYLSRKRAKAVREYLLEQGISSSRLRYKAFGESQPAATNKTEEGRRLNRRVEFVILSM